MKNIFTLFLAFVCLHVRAQTVTNKIVIDQFGYRPTAKKTAVIRNPQTGFDASESFSPGSTYEVINAENQKVIYSGTIISWNSGAENTSSGDQAWWFDFSSVTNSGSYYIYDPANDVKSYTFKIAENVYEEALKHAVRTFFYQRSGHEKAPEYAGSYWADNASHLGVLQDLNCRKFDSSNDSSTELDVHGGWYDAGDYNKYSIWTANYIVELLRAYQENPTIWTDDYNIPESGNGTPDLIDEVKWGLDHLLRLQLTDGSIISIVDAGHASPPSEATEQSLYGDVNTSSTLAASGAFALGATVFKNLGMSSYANELQIASEKAWDWAIINPNTLWQNNDAAYNSTGIGAGKQEVDDYGRLKYKLRAAVYLLEATGETSYKTYFDNNYDQIHMMQWTHAYPFEDEEQDILLEYTRLNDATENIVTDILSTFSTAMNGNDNFSAYENEKDPYKAHMKDYTWGSNKQKCSVGNMFYQVGQYNANASKADLGIEAAEEYLHYIHGVNPLGLLYLSNMYDYGGDNCVNQFYHSWFYEGTDYDEYGVSAYGPAPGFLTGGANPKYSIDGCCPSGCGSSENNAKCNFTGKNNLLNQPDQKSYLDFNSGWPSNSWEVTENSNGYQTEYIRLLSKFVTLSNITKSREVVVDFKAFPNPANEYFTIRGAEKIHWKLFDTSAKMLKSGDEKVVATKNISSGIYYLKIQSNGSFKTIKLAIHK